MRLGKLILSISLFVYATLVVASTSNGNLSKEQLEIIDLAVKKLNPQFNIKESIVDSISDLGLYKVVSNKDSEVFYISKEGRYFIYGDLLDLNNSDKNNRNITELSKMFIRKSAIDKFPINKMIVFKPKRNSWGIRKPVGIVTIVTDLDCPYGNRLHKEVEKAVDAGLEVRYLLFPRAGIGSDSYKKSVSVWCAKNHNKAFSMANNGETVASLSCKNDPIESQFNLVKKIGIYGTPTIILKDGKVIAGYVTSDSLLNLVKEENAHSSSR